MGWLQVLGERERHGRKGYTSRRARNDGGLQSSGRRQFSVAWARLHCEHDGEYRAARARSGARIRTIHGALVNRTRGLSCGGDTRRVGHGVVEW
jgi:hypothetical protein